MQSKPLLNINDENSKVQRWPLEFRKLMIFILQSLLCLWKCEFAITLASILQQVMMFGKALNWLKITIKDDVKL